jgi:hypothetical protein
MQQQYRFLLTSVSGEQSRLVVAPKRLVRKVPFGEVLRVP